MGERARRRGWRWTAFEIIAMILGFSSSADGLAILGYKLWQSR